MSETVYSHMIPATRRDRELLADLVPVFGTKARAVELALDYAMANGIPLDPAFHPDIQIHVHLSRDYRAIRDQFERPKYSASDLGAFLHAALVDFASRYANGHLERPKLWFWSERLPRSVVRSVQSRTFASGRDPVDELADLLRKALVQVEASLPPAEMMDVDVATDPALRDLYRRVAEAADKRGLDIDTLLIEAIARNETGATA